MKNKVFLFILFSFLVAGCKTSFKFIHPVGYENSFFPDSIYKWRVDSVFSTSDITYYTFPKIEEIVSLSEVKKTFYRKNGRLLNKKLINTDYIIALALNSSSTIIMHMRGEIPYYTSISTCGVTDWIEILYDEQGNIKRIENGALKDPLLFTKGTGYYVDTECIITFDSLIMKNVENPPLQKDTIYWDDKGLVHSISYSYKNNDSIMVKKQMDTHIKEEGKLEDNYKVGKWKYYDKEGNIIREVEYKLKDKVDVRFPYCIFNKQEPCFCNE